MKALEDLRHYIDFLKERNEIIEINEKISPILQIPAILRRSMRNNGPAILFTNIDGYAGWRVAGNLYRSIETVSQALGVHSLQEIGERMVSLALRELPLGLTDKLKALREVGEMGRYMPSTTRRASFTENIVDKSDNPLRMLPAFKTWPEDGGRYLTFPLVITRDPVRGVNNMGVYRVMLLDGRRAVIHWQIHKRGAQAYFDSEGKMPVAIAIGSDIGTMFTGVAPVPYPLDKFLFAGIVRGRGIRLYKLPNGLLVPANSEIVLEGYVVKGELHNEGPFGDHWGYYDVPQEMYPVFHVERMYYRDDPIYYGSVVGLPPLEDAVIGKMVERIFLPILKMLLPEIIEINFPVHGVFQGMMIVSIKKRYPGHAKKVMNALWGLGQTSLTKIIIVVDSDIDPHNIDQVIWAVSSNVNPQRDVIVQPYAHTDALDPAMIAPSYGSKLGIDATRKLPEENWGRPWPKMVEEDQATREWADRFYNKVISKWRAGTQER